MEIYISGLHTLVNPKDYSSNGRAVALYLADPGSGGTSPCTWSEHRNKFKRKADNNNKKNNIATFGAKVDTLSAL